MTQAGPCWPASTRARVFFTQVDGSKRTYNAKEPVERELLGGKN